MNVKSVSTELLDREKQILAAWKNNSLPATYASFLAPHVRMQRNGHIPTTNMNTINLWIAQLQKTLTWSTVRSGTASLGDLGVTYGFLEILNDPKGSKGNYVRI